LKLRGAECEGCGAVLRGRGLRASYGAAWQGDYIAALRPDFRPDSDVDVLVSFTPEANVSLFDMVHMQDELKQIFGRDVDLISKRGVQNSRNYLRRKAILESAQVIHVAR